MAVTISFNFNDTQQARIQQARDLYNAEHGTTLTPKQYLLTIIRDNVKAATVGAETDAAFAASQAAIETQVNADLQGNA